MSNGQKNNLVDNMVILELVREGFGKSHPGRLAFFVESLYSEPARLYSTGSRLTLSAHYS